jgi:pimeloyl-ACP methyl ester carboxylesterase
MFDVGGGTKVGVFCYGTGSPAVILESGYQAPDGLWDRVYPAIMSQTRVCLFSLSNPDNIHAALAKAGVPGPYILVGQSLAGINSRVFYSRWPKEVAAIALVDSVQPNVWPRMLALLPKQAGTDRPYIEDCRRNWTTLAPVVESYARPLSMTGSMGSLPLVVLSHTPGKERWCLDMEVNAAAEKEWEVMQLELAKLSTNSVHKVSARSSHAVPIDDPTLVINAILDLLKQVKSK